MDVLIMNLNEPPSLFRNDVSGSSHWLKVLLIGVESNRSAGLDITGSANETARIDVVGNPVFPVV